MDISFPPRGHVYEISMRFLLLYSLADIYIYIYTHTHERVRGIINFIIKILAMANLFCLIGKSIDKTTRYKIVLKLIIIQGLHIFICMYVRNLGFTKTIRALLEVGHSMRDYSRLNNASKNKRMQSRLNNSHIQGRSCNDISYHSNGKSLRLNLDDQKTVKGWAFLLHNIANSGEGSMGIRGTAVLCNSALLLYPLVSEGKAQQASGLHGDGPDPSGGWVMLCRAENKRKELIRSQANSNHIEYLKVSRSFAMYEGGTEGWQFLSATASRLAQNAHSRKWSVCRATVDHLSDSVDNFLPGTLL